MKFRFALASALSLVVFAAAAKADIIVNGDFARDPSTPYTFPGYGPITGWTGTSSNGNTGSNVAGQPFFNGNPPAGITTVGFVQAASINPDFLTQSLTNLTVGATYDYSFYENARSGNSVTLSLLVGGNQVFTNTVNASDSFTLITGSFVATTSTEDFAFEASTTAPNDETALITGVSVAETPEPSSLILLGTGLVSAAGFARRRFGR